MVITLLGKFLLRTGDNRNGRLVVRIVVVLTIILFVLVDVRTVVTRSVTVWIVVVTVAVVIVGVPIRPPWLEPEVEDDPGTVNKTAVMSVPDMIAAPVPIAMPIR
jgi:hypothetical protein